MAAKGEVKILSAGSISFKNYSRAVGIIDHQVVVAIFFIIRREIG